MRLVVPAAMLLSLFTLAACAPTKHTASQEIQTVPSSHDIHAPAASVGGHVKRGTPYQIAGKWYYPLSNGEFYDQSGIASWYGEEFHGKKTANGELYDMHTFTAAHTTLPLPSVVLVTNLENGKQIKVRVNDRGPFVKNRLIDLSYAAAQALGYDKQGTTRVRVQTLQTPSTSQLDAAAAIGEKNEELDTTSEAEAQKSVKKINQEIMPKTMPVVALPAVIPAEVKQPEVAQQFTSQAATKAVIQVGAFGNKTNADGLVKQLQAGFGESMPAPYVMENSGIYRVRLGPFVAENEAVQALQLVQSQGFGAAMIVHE
ncbi:MAG: hypothetical protein AUK35_08130 [Zetaproteobacteria bacterium CG2_30_46_52]|nr:MAG: hypothetical protein AUK35_08130 [Zetaproteobacteria bacterium CG2_30_46_52]